MTPKRLATIIAMTSSLLLATAAANGSILLASIEHEHQSGCYACNSTAIALILETYSTNGSSLSQLGLNYPLWEDGDSGSYTFHSGDGPDFWNMADNLTNGIDDSMSLLSYVPGRGGGGAGGTESFWFGAQPDLQGNVIDFIQLNVRDVYIEPYRGSLYTGAHVTYEFWGHAIPEPATLGLMLIVALTMATGRQRRSRSRSRSRNMNLTSRRSEHNTKAYGTGIALLVLLPAGVAKAGLPAYQIQGLGTNILAVDINNNGDIVGPNYLYQNGSLIDLGIGNLGAINNVGAIIGTSEDCDLYPEESSGGAFYYQNGVKTCIEGYIPHSRMLPWSLNDHGLVIGYDTRTQRSFVWSDGVTIDPNDDNSGDWATDVNNHGQVLRRTSLWEAGVLRPLGFSGVQLNDVGQIVTFASQIWQDGVFTEMGRFLLDGTNDAKDLNNLGHVIGQSFGYRSGNFGLYQWLWTDGAYYLLDDLLPPDSGWRIHDARAINDLGQIVGRGDHNGVTEAFVMTPVPEPASAAMLVLALSMLRPNRMGRRRGNSR